MGKRRNKFAFTDHRLSRIKADKKRRRCYYDTKCPGLELRVSPSGYKVFSFVAHRGMRERLGQFPPLTVKIARGVANEKRLCVELGVNPVQRENLGTLWAKYREDMIERKCVELVIKRCGSRFQHLAKWSHKRLDRISPDMVRDLKRGLERTERKGITYEVLGLLRAMTNFAKRRGWVGISPLSGLNLTFKRYRTRFIEPHELYGFITTLEKQGDVFSDLILVALFTGVRRGEVQKARWEDVDLDLKRWMFDGSKGGRRRAVYFSDYVEKIFRKRWEEAEKGAEFVFANPFTGNTPTWVRSTMFRAEMVARGLPEDTRFRSVKNEFSMHTLRHTFVTYAMRAGIPLQVLQNMVGHALPSQLRVTVFLYGHSNDEWEREGFQKVTNVIRKLAWKRRLELLSKAKESTSAQDEKLAVPPIPGTGRSREKSLNAQKAAYLRYFRRKRAEARRPRKRLVNRTAKDRNTIAAGAKQKVINQIVAMRDAGKSAPHIAFMLTQQGLLINASDVYKILKKADAEKLTSPSSKRGVE